MSGIKELQEKYNEYKSLNLKLNIERGQPSDDNLSLSNPMLTIVTEKDLIASGGIEIRNYPGGVEGLREARELFGNILGIKPEETIVENNASLRLIVNTLMWGLIKGLKNSPRPWVELKKPKFIVTVPGYDRHFKLLNDLGFDMIAVKMTSEGPDMDEVERIAGSDEKVVGILFVPTYSNPTGDCISDKNVMRLASMKTKASDFTIFADDAYLVHHLTKQKIKTLNILKACREAGNSDRALLFSSTSKITFSGAGIGFMGADAANIKYISGLMGSQFITPNKIEQLRHVKFLNGYRNGVEGLMEDHANILAPKFKAVQDILNKELGGAGLAEWSDPKGGYFVSLDTSKPVASRVVALVKEAGVALTPAGATFPFGKDPKDSNIRISPTRPSVKEVEEAIKILCLCVKLASAEYGSK